MLIQCWAFNCKHYSEKNYCKFFKFPTTKKIRLRWIKLLKRASEPGVGARFCSCYFRDGNKQNDPEILEHRKNSFDNFPSPEKRKRINKQQPQKLSFNVVDNVIFQGYIQPTQATSTSTSTSTTTSNVLETENYLLRKENEELKQKLSSLSERLSFEMISSIDDLIKLYTGLPNSKIFNTLYQMFKNIEINYYLKLNIENISRQDQLLITLMKLRLNLPCVDLAQRFNCSQAAITNIFTTWLHILYENIFLKLMSKIPSKNKNKLCLPNAFSTFTNCRIILDCTEIPTDTNRVSLTTQKATYSSYKHYHTLKVLLGVSLNGIVTFVSSLFPGVTPDNIRKWNFFTIRTRRFNSCR